MNKKIGTIIGAGTVTVGILCSLVYPTLTTTVQAEYVVDFQEGDYSGWDGISYTFDWYRNPEIEDGVKKYTIKSASDLAGLTVVTNNIKGSEYEDITVNIQEEDAEFIELVDTFKDSIIILDCNIDLKDFEWLPISYPWDTMQLNSKYEFLNTDDRLVKYNAVDYVPDDRVDEWVGDGVTTRYYEFPESELRFRDLINGITIDNLHTFINAQFNANEEVFYNNDYKATIEDSKFISFIDSYAIDHGTSVYNKYALTASMRGLIDGVANKEVSLKSDVIIPYTFKNIAEYREYVGFEGVFDGNNKKIKGLNPSTRWVDDTAKRLETYEPIARGLFSVIAEDGQVKDLAVKGSYNEKIVSYSAILCGYNYGEINNCYIDGYIKESLIEQIYPVSRQFNGSNYDYILSEDAGTVLPSGNNGFMTSQNYGRIVNSYTVGEVEQAYRQFGFIAATNYGSIVGCENRGNLKSERVTTDFHTDEWSNIPKMSRGVTALTIPYTSDRIDYMDITVPEGDVSPNKSDLSRMYTTYMDYISRNLVRATATGITTSNLKTTAVDLADIENIIWIPTLNGVEAGDSVVKNHMFGQYIMTVAGGIAAVNFGEISESNNKGEIHTLYNVTESSNFSIYNTDVTIVDKEDANSYIRPQNQYGLFSTTNRVYVAASGIAAINMGELRQVENSGNIIKHTEEISEGSKKIDNGIEFLAYTENGYYQNDVYYRGELRPYAFRWWVTEENKADEPLWVLIVGTTGGSDTGYTKQYNNAEFDRNMPYPFYYGINYGLESVTGGISVSNTGVIDTVGNDGEVDYVVCAYSKGMNGESASISNLTNNQILLIAENIEDTDISNIHTYYTAFRTIKQIDSNVLIEDLVVDSKNAEDPNDNSLICALARTIQGTEKESLKLRNIAVIPKTSIAITLDTFDIDGLYFNINSFYDGMIREMNNGKMQNVLIQGIYAQEDTKVSVFPSVKNVEFTDIALITEDVSKLGKFTDCKFTNMYFNSGVTKNEFNRATIGKLINCELDNIRINGNNSFMDCENCLINDYISTGIILKDYVPVESGAFVYKFKDSNCTDMYLESEIEFDYVDPLTEYRLQYIPGVLKAYSDTNTFDRCAVVTSDGMVSYPSINTASIEDGTIRTDAQMVYSKDAASNGALAYYLDKGNTENRTFDYTVAKADKVNLADYIPNGVYDYIEDDKLAILEQTYDVPAYTRRKEAESEDSYYALKIPNTGAGVGEVKAIVERDGILYSTYLDKLFPKDELYVVAGEKVKIDVIAAEGHKLKNIVYSTKNSSVELPSKTDNTKEYEVDAITMPAEDVTLLAEWADVHKIEIEVADWVDVISSAESATKGRNISLRLNILDNTKTIKRLYYCKYVKNSDNMWIIDTENEYNIDLESAIFEMPDADIRIYAESIGNEAELRDIVIAGVHGIIKEDNTVLVTLENSVDITSLNIDSVELSEGAELIPGIEEKQDFSKSVEYIVRAASGVETQYTVMVIAVKDGEITDFEFKGRKGLIDNENNTITVTIPETEDISNVKPTIIWSGMGITHENEYLDFNNDVEYRVTSSDGYEKVYKVIINKVHYSSIIEVLSLETDDNIMLDVKVDEDRKQIIVEYPYAADVSNVYIKSFAYSGETANMTNNAYLNLTKSNDLIIVDTIGEAQRYTIIAVEKPSIRKEITQFRLYGINGEIDEETGEITVEVAKKYDITDIAPDVVSYIGKNITDITEKHNFEESVVYTVEAFDGSTKEYTVRVIQK